MKKLRILRGLPGSGKSFLANQWAKEGAAVFSTDDVLAKDGFWTEEGSIEAHHENQWRVARAMREGFPDLVVDNPNIRPFVIAPYVRLAKHYNYDWTIEDMKTSWALDVDELTKRNVHGVFRSTIEAMYKTYIAIPAQAMVVILTCETPMDPEVALRTAQEALECEDNFLADEQIMDYQDWRKIGGFEPIGGDETADNISDKLIKWRSHLFVVMGS